ncbi:MAG: response regulator [Planctomycetota bacterium]
MATVLVADNDPGVRALLAEVVRRQGFQVATASDGLEARAALLAAQVDLFVCDLDMPRMSGPQVLQWLAAQPNQPPVVVVSGYLDARSEADLGQLPCVRALLRKPFDVLAFVQLVQSLAGPTERELGA